MKTQQRTAILTLSALALVTSIAGLAFFDLGRPSNPQASAIDAGVGPTARAPQAATSRPETAPVRQNLDQRTADEVASGLFSAAPGTRLAFDLVNTGSSTMSNHEGAVFQSLEVDLRGEFAVEVLARRGDEMAFTARLPHCKLEQRVDGAAMAPEASEALAASLARPVIVRARVDGTILGFRFDAQAPPDERNRMRTLLCALMPVAPEPLRETWVGEQQDVLGVMRSSYGLVSADATRVEIVRNSRECVGTDASRPIPKFTGTARIGIDRGLGWFDSVTADEAASIDVDLAGWTILSHQAARCTLTGVRHDGPVGIDWDLPWDPASGTADAARVAELHREQGLRNALNGRTLDQLVDQLAALLAAGDFAAPELVHLREELGFLLSIDADALAAVAELVLDPRLSPDVVAALIGCVGRAGTPEAQALLAQWLSDAKHDVGLRTESVYALIELKQPGDNVVAAVAGLLALDTDPKLQGSAILTLGALANIGGSHTSAGISAFHHVMNWKQAAEDSNRLPEWIEALGNTGSPQVVDAVRPYLVYEDDSVRASAVHALRLVFTLEVSDIAAACGQLDVSVNVRGRAAEVLGMRVDGHARAAIGAMLENEAFDGIRETLILHLGSHAANDLPARVLLEDAAATDPSAELRQLAQQQLAGPHNG